MKRTSLFPSAVILFTIMLASPANAQKTWQDVSNGIRDLDLTAVAAHPNIPDIVYVGSSKSVFKTIDGGKSWQEVLQIRGTRSAVNYLTIDPRDSKIAYAATENGLFKTKDSGKSWQRIFEGIGAEEKNVTYLLIDPADSKKMYAGTGKGLFLSSDGGKTWQKESRSLSDYPVTAIAANPRKPEILYLANYKGVFRSRDRGKSWNRIFITSVEADTVNEQNENENFNTNEHIGSAELVNSIAVDPFDPETIYLGTQKGNFISRDGGFSWQALPETGLTIAKTRHLLPSLEDQNALYAATRKGVFEYSKKERAWKELYSGITSRNVRFLALTRTEPKELWAATASGIFKTKFTNKSSLFVKFEPALEQFADEPSILEIQEVAMEYAEVKPEKIQGWRRAAENKAWLPEVSVGVDGDIARTIDLDRGGTGDPDFYITGPKDKSFGWDVNLSWDLGELIWNDDQCNIDVRSKLMVQLRDDILDEVTKFYFERRRLQVDLLTNPPKDTKERIEKELRLQELTANIDALTGGYLSQKLGTETTF